MKEMKHDSSTLAWSAMGDEWFELAQTGESRIHFIMPNMLKFMGDVAGRKILDLGCGDFEGTLREVVRVLKPGGRLFASVLHPCFDGNHDIGIGRQGVGIDRQVVVMNYFEPKEWEAPLWGGKTPVIWRHRTMEDYVKTFLKVGLTIVDMNEPRATDEQAEISVAMAWLQKIPLYLYWELRK